MCCTFYCCGDECFIKCLQLLFITLLEAPQLNSETFLRFLNDSIEKAHMRFFVQYHVSPKSV